MPDFHRADIQTGRHTVLKKRRIHRLTFFADDLFRERMTDAADGRAFQLSLHEHLVQRLPAVMNHGHSRHFGAPGIGIHLHLRHLGPERVGSRHVASARLKIGNLEAFRRPIPSAEDGLAGSGILGDFHQFAERYASIRTAGRINLAVLEHNIIGTGF